MKRLWDKGAPLDARALEYTAGGDHELDNRLVAYDVRASVAHAHALHRAGLLSGPELAALETALADIGAAHARGEWRVSLEEEDGQTALELRLTERLGPTGGRIHLGRSRNDQVLAALRLYMREMVETLRIRAEAVAAALEALAERQGDIVLPGYTHMQQAMESSVRLWGTGFAAEIRDDAEGLRLAHRRIGRNPLGSAAGYGTPGLPLDRNETTRLLGFAETQEPVTAVQISRGKAEAQLLFEITLLITGLGRLAADLLLFYTEEFGYVRLAETHTTGSSIMPQKRNPDILELVRGRGATVCACLHEALAVIQKLPSGYHRDLQLLKAPLFRGIDTALATLEILPPVIDALEFLPDRIRLAPDIQAAAKANALVVREGITFREAYRRVAEQLKAP